MPKGRPKKKVEPSTTEQPAMEAPPTPAQLSYARAYDHGLRDGYNAAVQRILASLGLSLSTGQAVGGEPTPATTEAADEEEEAEATPPPPPPPLADEELPPPLCAWCGHDEEAHKPVEAKKCFAKGCECKGFTLKAPVKIGKLKIRRGG